MLYKNLFDNSIKRSNTIKSIDPIDIQLLIQNVFSLSKEKFWINKNHNITNKSALQKFYRYFNRLKNGEPVQYIIQKTEFYSLLFYVKKGVLIPRPETEILIDEVLKLVDKSENILDIGAGSGAISIALAKNSNANITALEKSKNALPILKRNIAIHRLQSKIKIIKADLFPVGKKMFDIIVSNPPYISEKEWEGLEDKVKKFEPKMALVGGKKGTEIIGKIVLNTKKYLKKGGSLLIEIGYDQSESVSEIFENNNFKKIRTISDYSGIGRVVIGVSVS